MPNQAQPLDYATPSTPGARIFWVKPTFLCCFVCWFWVFIALFVMPRFEVIFKDFNVPLPLITRIGIQFCHLIAASPVWIILGVAPLFIPLFIPRSHRRPFSAWLFLVLGYLALGLSIVLLVGSVMLPMLTLVDAISGTKGR